MNSQLRLPRTWFIVGVFALLAGVAFTTSLTSFVDQSREALSTPPPEPINVNQLLIRPFLLQVGAAALLVLPLVTARVFSRAGSADLSAEARSAKADSGSAGRVLSTFGATLSVYAVMLAASLVLVGVLFVFGAPEWGPVLSGYFGLLLIGAAFIASALFISSLATSARAAAVATFALSLAIAAAAWLARSGTPAAQAVFRSFSVGEQLDDFAKGVIDTAPVVTCIAIAAAALFLTRRALEPRPTER